MNYVQYRAMLIALIQALKAELGKRPIDKESQNVHLLYCALVWIIKDITPPHDGFALRNQINSITEYIRDWDPSEENWSVSYELCRDALGMLDVPYEER